MLVEIKQLKNRTTLLIIKFQPSKDIIIHFVEHVPTKMEIISGSEDKTIKYETIKHMN